MVVAQNKQYFLSEIAEGMLVKVSQLSNIFGKHIILTNPSVTDDGDIEGVIGFIGSNLDARSDSLNDPQSPVAHIYHDADEKDGEVYYDE